MNRYVVAGLLAEARAGKPVLVVSETTPAARAAFESIAATATEASYAPATVSRSHGRERVSLPTGGRITFMSAGSTSAERGVQADVVFVDADITVDMHQRLMIIGAELLRR